VRVPPHHRAMDRAGEVFRNRAAPAPTPSGGSSTPPWGTKTYHTGPSHPPPFRQVRSESVSPLAMPSRAHQPVDDDVDVWAWFLSQLRCCRRASTHLAIDPHPGRSPSATRPADQLWRGCPLAPHTRSKQQLGTGAVGQGGSVDHLIDALRRSSASHWGQWGSPARPKRAAR